MNYYDAKFRREAMPTPTDWVIRPLGHGQYALDNIAAGKVITVADHARACAEAPVSQEDLDIAALHDLRELDYGMMP